MKNKLKDTQCVVCSRDATFEVRRSIRKAWEKVCTYHAASLDGSLWEMRAYYSANKEKLAARQRAYYSANKEKLAACQRAYQRVQK